MLLSLNFSSQDYLIWALKLDVPEISIPLFKRTLKYPQQI